MRKFYQQLCDYSNSFTTLFNWLQSIVALGIRYYLFSIFFQSGWVKLKSCQSTVYLFEYEYKVPVLSANAAAILGTAAVLLLPIFLLLGFGSRIAAFILFLFNIIMIYSYPFLFTAEGSGALKDHITWGILIGVLLFYGPARISLDYFINRKYCKNYKY